MPPDVLVIQGFFWQGRPADRTVWGISCGGGTALGTDPCVLHGLRSEPVQLHAFFSKCFCLLSAHIRHLRPTAFPQVGQVMSSSLSLAPQQGQNFGLFSQGAQSTHCSTSALYMTSLTQRPHVSQ